MKYNLKKKLTIISQFGGDFHPGLFDVQFILVMLTGLVVEGRPIGELLNETGVQVAHIVTHLLWSPALGSEYVGKYTRTTRDDDDDDDAFFIVLSSVCSIVVLSWLCSCVVY